MRLHAAISRVLCGGLQNDNQIESLDADTFQYLPNLHQLSLNVRALAVTPNHVDCCLAGWAGLWRSIELIVALSSVSQNNFLTRISPVTFSSLRMLARLDLSDNQLDEVRAERQAQAPERKRGVVGAALCMTLTR